MKKIWFVAILLPALSATAALDAAAQAQLRIQGDSEELSAASEKLKPLPKTPKPAATKTKKKKAPAEKPISEYKFDRIDHIPAYKFDKKTNPIIKAPKPKKAAKKPAAAKKKAAAPQPTQQTAAGQDEGKLQMPEGNSQQTAQEQPEE